jgi:tol-pal system protein YbgF
MNQQIKKKFLDLVISLCLLLPITLWAEAPVAEAQASSTGGYSSSMEGPDPEIPLSQDSSSSVVSSSSSFNPNSPASLLAKFNQMQQEMQKLRGQLEVQSYELKKLKQQQQTYYNDLDLRISTLSSGKKSPVLDMNTGTPAVTTDVDTGAASSAAKKSPASAVVRTSSTGSTTEESSYNAAYELIQNKQFSEATTAMKTFIKQYPHGKYAANAHYWLGELLLAQHQDQNAMKEFDIVTHDYPTSNKVSAAMLKLGYIYAKQGDTEKAKTVFLNIQKMFPGTTTSDMATQRLNALSA